MIKIQFSEFVTKEEAEKLHSVADLRIAQQNVDFLYGDGKASYRYGNKNTLSLEEKDKKVRLQDVKIGVYSEYIISKLMNIEYVPQFYQYKNNKKPDLTVFYKSKEYKCEVRGTRDGNHVIFRQRDFKISPDIILGTVCNYKNLDHRKSIILYAGYMFFGDLQKMDKIKCENKFGEYYKIDSKYFLTDFESFYK